MTLLDAKESRPLTGGPSFSVGHRIYRSVWMFTWLLLAAWTPAPLHRWRVWLLNRFGARIDSTAHVYGSVRVWYPPNLKMEAGSCLGPGVTCYCMSQIWLRQFAIISQGAHICAGMHDIEDPNFQLLVAPIVIGTQAWVAAECFVGPGVTIGDGAVLGARAVMFKDAVPNGVYVGNPAQLIKTRKLGARGYECG